MDVHPSLSFTIILISDIEPEVKAVVWESEVNPIGDNPSEIPDCFSDLYGTEVFLVKQFFIINPSDNLKSEVKTILEGVREVLKSDEN